LTLFFFFSFLINFDKTVVRKCRVGSGRKVVVVTSLFRPPMFLFQLVH